MAVTAETRNAIIELVVTAYDAAPGTTLLTELVNAADGGATLQDIAATLTTSSTFTSIYPSFLTVEEFADQFLAALVPSVSSDSDAYAEGKAAIEFVLNSGGTRADVVSQAQTFLAGLEETDAAFGEPAAAFNNKVEVATYHTVNQKQDGDIDNLQSILTDVTSDDESVTAAQENVDNSAPGGETIALTDEIEEVSGTSRADTIRGVTDGTDSTLQSGDTIDGLGGADRMEVTIDSTGMPAGASIENVENFFLRNVSGAAKTSSFAGVDDSVAQVWNDRSVAGSHVTANNVASLATVGVRATDTDTTVSFLNSLLSGSSDSVTVTLDRADGGDVTIASSGSSGTETIVLNSGGTSANEIGTLDDDGENDFTTLTITGDQDLEVGGIGSSVTSVDASGFTGSALEISVGAAAAAEDFSYTGSAGDDDVSVTSTDVDDVLDGGDGTDSITSTGTFGATVSNFESLTQVVTGATATVDLEEADDIASLVIAKLIAGLSTFALTNLNADQVITVSSDINSTPGGEISLEDDDGSSDEITLNFIGNGTINQGTQFDFGELETLNLSSASDLTLDVNDGLGGGGDFLEELTISGSGDLTISNDLIDVAAAHDLEVDASDVTGTVLIDNDAALVVGTGGGTTTFMSGSGNDTIDLSGDANGLVIDGGAGNDTITGGENDDEIDGGAGNDSITWGNGSDEVTGGSGSDTYVQNVAFANDNDNTITDFSLSSTSGDLITGLGGIADAFTDADDYLEIEIDAADVTQTAAVSVVVDGDDDPNTADSLSDSDVAAFLADVDGDGNGFVSANSGDDSIIIVTDGSDTGIFVFDDGNDNTTVDADELTLIITLEGISDPTGLAAGDFTDIT